MNLQKRAPDAFVILFALILICAAATWFVPGGAYVTADDGTVSFERVSAVPQTWQVFSALYEGFKLQAGIIAFILIVGGAFWVLNATGAVAFGIRRFVARVRGSERWVLIGITLLFSLAGAVFGMSEETIPFVGIVVPLVVSMGFDAITGLLIVYVAANIGFSSAFLNPFTVGIAQEMAGLPLFSGMGYRILCWALLTAVLIVFILIYTSRIKKSSSEVEPANPVDEDGVSKGRKIVVLCILLVTMVALIVGVTVWKWYITEIAALFLAMGIACGAAAGFGPWRISREFVAGAKDIFSAALVVGLASGMVVILQNGRIMDSILHGLESGLGDGGRTGALTVMYGTQTLINLLIPSATAKAAITIPIMAPFSDLIGLSRQACVLAFQFGDGFTNMLTPTSGVLVAALAMAKVPYTKWVKFAWKYVLVLILVGFILLLPTVLLPLEGF